MNTQAKTGGLLKPVLLLVLGLAMIGGAYVLATKSSRDAEALKHQQEAVMKQQREAFFAAQVPGLLDEEEKRNLAALNRAQVQLNEVFARYQARVPAFAEELTTWGVKFKLAKASLADWWSETNEARRLATDLFANHVVSDRGLERDVTSVVNQFIADLTANRNVMLSELSRRVSTAQLPIANGAEGAPALTAAFQEELNVILKRQATQAPVITALAFGGGWLAEEGVRKLVGRVVSSLTARLAASAAVRGGAAAGGAASGGAAGTVIAPGVGTAIGVAAGLVAGFAVDMWMEKKFKEQVTEECRNILNQMQNQIWNDQATGLNSQFTLLTKTTRSIHEEALKKVILGGTE